MGVLNESKGKSYKFSELTEWHLLALSDWLEPIGLIIVYSIATKCR
jgi:hypothetical protein